MAAFSPRSMIASHSLSFFIPSSDDDLHFGNQVGSVCKFAYDSDMTYEECKTKLAKLRELKEALGDVSSSEMPGIYNEASCIISELLKLDFPADCRVYCKEKLEDMREHFQRAAGIDDEIDADRTHPQSISILISVLEDNVEAMHQLDIF